MIDVLLVEDELKLAHIVMASLTSKRFNVRHSPTATSALASYSKAKPDIMVMDISMPEMDGFTLASKIREHDTSTPMIFLTARTATEDLLRGFEVGGNDYLKKPFIIAELIARINSLISLKEQSTHSSHVNIGKYRLNPQRQILQFGEEVVHLSYRHSELLNMLYQNQGTVLLRDEVLNAFHNSGQATSGRSLDVFICRLRKYLVRDARIQITTVRGIGYKMMVYPTVEESQPDPN